MQRIFERINEKLDGEEEALGISLFNNGIVTLEAQGLIYDGGDEGNEWFISDKKDEQGEKALMEKVTEY